jgi:diguanylate cyclase (GGDEF)-like protein
MAARQPAAAGCRLRCPFRAQLIVAAPARVERALKRRAGGSDDAHMDPVAPERDSLTGLLHGRVLDERLAAEAARLRRHGGQGSVCVIDLDGFKRVNDTLGHAAGDDVLCAVAAHLGEVRGEDSAYRIGGDEFALILVAADEEGAALAALRIAEAVRSDPACHGVSVSFGVARIDEDDPREAVARAGAAMYEAKRASSS